MAEGSPSGLRDAAQQELLGTVTDIGLVLLAGWIVLRCEPANRLAALGGLSALFPCGSPRGVRRTHRVPIAGMFLSLEPDR